MWDLGLPTVYESLSWYILLMVFLFNPYQLNILTILAYEIQQQSLEVPVESGLLKIEAN